MKRILPVLIGLLLAGMPSATLCAQHTGTASAAGTLPSQQKQENIVNFGAKGGFTSSLFLVSDLTFGDITIKEIQNNYRIGFFGSLFMRINFGRHFLQPELSYALNRSYITFQLPLTPDAPQGTQSMEVFIKSDIHSIDVPVLYGWNIIKEHPYSMALFIGPKLRYILEKKSHTNFNNYNQQEINERLRPFNLGLSLGVAVTISPIFFDFRYDISLNNISRRVIYDPSESVSPDADLPDIRFNHRDNVLSFSLGVFF